jgi:PhnB protein
MKIIPHLNFNGQCEEAFTLYAKVFGGTPNYFRYGGSPAAGMAPESWAQKILHASLPVEDQTIYGADVPPQYQKTPQGFAVCLDMTDVDKAEPVFKALSEGGTVKMAFAETFWALRYGDLIDRFGIPWMVNVSKPM